MTVRLAIEVLVHVDVVDHERDQTMAMPAPEMAESAESW